MKLLQTTKKWNNWWQGRKINWVDHYLKSYNHPHRNLISIVLSYMNWGSLFEVGCGAGANLVNIIKKFPGRQLGGVDINPDAIKTAQEAMSGFFKVGSATDVPMSDNSTDVVLTDMCLIYQDPSNIDKAISEIKRVARNYIVLCEFHHKSWFKRIQLRWTKGYYAYDYKKLLTKHGFYDVMIRQIPPEGWDGHEPQKTYAHIVTAKVPKRKF